MLKNEYPKEFDRYKNLSTEKLKELLNNLDSAGVPFRKGGKVKKEEAEKRAQEIKKNISHGIRVTIRRGRDEYIG